MKVYEIGLKDETDCRGNCECILWIATDISIKQTKNSKSEYYIKEIPEYDENTGGIDFVIK